MPHSARPAGRIPRFEDSPEQWVMFARWLVRSSFPDIPKDDVDDARQEALVAMVEARRRWDSRRSPWAVYASLRARGAVLDYLRRQRPGSRRLGERPVVVSIGDADFAASVLVGPDTAGALVDSDIGSVTSAIGRLGRERDRFIAAAVLLRGETLRDVGERVGVTESRVAQIMPRVTRQIACDPAVRELADAYGVSTRRRPGRRTVRPRTR